MKNRIIKVVFTFLLCGGVALSSHTALLTEASEIEEGFEITEGTTEQEAVSQNEIIIPEAYENLNLYAQSAVLIDGDTNRILYAKNADALMPNASTTKILTCILAIELGEMNQVCPVSDYARTMPETKCGFYEGDSFFLKDLLYSLMLESHNDSAVVIAETIGGSVEGFAQLMNEKAAGIGCTNSYFITPNGLDGEDETGIHGASAYDLALIMNYCRQNETFLEITQAASHTFSDVEGKHTYSVSNKNSFLTMQSGAITGKTGFTSKAGYCYVGAYQENGRNYSYAVLACGWPNNKTYKWKDSKALIAYGNEYYQDELVGETETLYELEIPQGITIEADSFDYRTTTKVKNDGNQWEMLLGEQDQVTTEFVYEPVLLPIKRNEKAGVVNYYINGNFAGTQDLFYTENVLKQDLKWCFTYFLQEFLQKASF